MAANSNPWNNGSRKSMGRNQGKGGNAIFFAHISLMETVGCSRWQFDDGEGNMFAWSVTNRQLEVSVMDMAADGTFG